MKSKHREILYSVIITLMIVAILWVTFVVSTIATSQDHDRGSLLLHGLVENYCFTAQRADGLGPAVYFIPNAWRDHLCIHGHYSESEIREITSVTKELQERRSEKKTIELRFYEEELNEETFYRKVVVK